MRIAIIGTVGVPANYGGFETLVENLIGKNCSSDIEYTVFCSKQAYQTKLSKYKNAKLVYLPFKATGLQSIFYDAFSLLKSMGKFDIILYLGVSVPILNIFKRLSGAKLIANVDGLSQERGKYNKFQKLYLRYLTTNEMLKPDAIISDNKGIQDYAKNNYNRDSFLIAYGGDQVLRKVTPEEQNRILTKYGLFKDKYAISVCRIEPENNCHMTLEAFAKANRMIFFIGNWDKSEYGRSLKEKYKNNPNVITHNPIYDIDELYALRNNANIYVHGHSVGGTNPSLVEAMFFKKPIVCFNVIYNRETTYNLADYFSSVDELILQLNNHKNSGNSLYEKAMEEYTWKKITLQYENVYRKVLNDKK